MTAVRLNISGSKERAAKDDAGDSKVDDEAGHIHQCGDEWSRSTGRIEAEFAKHERQRGAGKRAEEHNAYKAGADRDGDQQVVGSVKWLTRSVCNFLPH